MQSFKVRSNESACRKKVRLGMEQVVRALLPLKILIKEFIDNLVIDS